MGELTGPVTQITHRLAKQVVLLGQEHHHVEEIDHHGLGLRTGLGAKGFAEHAHPVHLAQQAPHKQEAALGAAPLHLESVAQ